MANVNIRTPRFYPDQINFLLNRGIALTEFKLLTSGSNLITSYQTGSDAQLFDMNPSATCSWDTSSNRSDHILINIDKQLQPTLQTNFIAVLNHNMASASASLRISNDSSESDVQAVDMGSASAMANLSEVVNADTISSNRVTPATDGSTIFTFDANTNRHIGIQFEGSDSTQFHASTDLFIGCIIIGEYYDIPRSPELSVKRSISFDKVTQIESLGGRKFSNILNFGKSLNSPFTTTSDDQFKIYGGRISYNLKFNYLASTDIMPDSYQSLSITDDSVIGDVWNFTHGSHIPFIFSTDNTSTGANAESDHMFARFGQDSLNMTQVAPDVFNISMRIEEEF